MGDMTVTDPAQKCLNSRLINLNNVLGDIAVGLCVSASRRFSVWRVYQTKTSLAFFIKPIGHEFDAVFILSFKIQLMRFRDVLGRQARHVVSVHFRRRSRCAKTGRSSGRGEGPEGPAY